MPLARIAQRLSLGYGPYRTLAASGTLRAMGRRRGAALEEGSADAGSATWLAILARAEARGEVPPAALHPRIATVAIVLLRNEFITRGFPTVPDEVLTEIIDRVYLPLVRHAE